MSFICWAFETEVNLEYVFCSVRIITSEGSFVPEGQSAMSEAILGSCNRVEDGWIFVVFSEWNTGRPLNILCRCVSCFLTTGREKFKGEMTYFDSQCQSFQSLGSSGEQRNREPGIRAVHTILEPVLPDLFSHQSLCPHCYCLPTMLSDDKPIEVYALSVSGPSLSSHFSMHESNRWEPSLLQMILWGETFCLKWIRQKLIE